MVYKNIEDYHPNKKQKILIVFDDMIANMLNSKKLNPIVTKLFIRQKTKYFFCFYYRILFCFPKDTRPNSTHYFIMKILNKRELKQIAFNHLDFIKSFNKIF